MNIAYSTYALQSIDPFEAIKRVHAIGYDGLELNVGDEWPTAAAKLDADDRRRLCDAYTEAGFPSPVLMHLINLCAPDEDTAAKSAALAATCQLACDLRVDDLPPIVTTSPGSHGVSRATLRDQVSLQLCSHACSVARRGPLVPLETRSCAVFVWSV